MIDLSVLREQGRTALSEGEAKSLLKEYGIKTTEFVIPRREELSDLDIQFPAVVKVNSPDILHKTDRNGVFLDIDDREELMEKYDLIKDRFKQASVLVEPMEKGGIEAIVGLVKDEAFGLSIMFGVGGIFTELYQDVSFRKVPITVVDAREMIEDIQGRRLFEGFRGKKADKEGMVELLHQISEMGEELKKDINQVDLNPVIVYEEGYVVVDVKILLEST